VPGIGLRHWKRRLVIGVLVAVAAVAGGPFVYIHFIEGSAPAPLALSPSPSSTTQGSAAASGTSGGTNGAWDVARGSVVGYRVSEILFGQSNTAVGRTSSITG